MDADPQAAITIDECIEQLNHSTVTTSHDYLSNVEVTGVVAGASYDLKFEEDMRLLYNGTVIRGNAPWESFNKWEVTFRPRRWDGGTTVSSIDTAVNVGRGGVFDPAGYAESFTMIAPTTSMTYVIEHKLTFDPTLGGREIVEHWVHVSTDSSAESDTPDYRQTSLASFFDNFVTFTEVVKTP